MFTASKPPARYALLLLRRIVAWFVATAPHSDRSQAKTTVENAGPPHAPPKALKP
jgi:hypothetical protein